MPPRDAGVGAGLGELHRSAYAVVIRQGEGLVAQRRGRRRQLVRLADAVVKGEGGVGVQLGVGHARCGASGRSRRAFRP